MSGLATEPEGFTAIREGSRSAPGDTEPTCCPPTLKGSQGQPAATPSGSEGIFVVLSPVVALHLPPANGCHPFGMRSSGHFLPDLL
jgi:hypothetical protein